MWLRTPGTWMHPASVSHPIRLMGPKATWLPGYLSMFLFLSAPFHLRITPNPSPLRPFVGESSMRLWRVGGNNAGILTMMMMGVMRGRPVEGTERLTISDILIYKFSPGTQSHPPPTRCSLLFSKSIVGPSTGFSFALHTKWNLGGKIQRNREGKAAEIAPSNSREWWWWRRRAAAMSSMALNVITHSSVRWILLPGHVRRLPRNQRSYIPEISEIIKFNQRWELGVYYLS